MTNDQILDAVAGMTVNELVALTKEIEDRFEVSVTDLRQPINVVEETEPEEEKTEFDVVLTDIGPKKIEVIKAVRVFTGLGLKESKHVTEACSIVAKDLPKAEAEQAKRSLESAGATVALK